MYSIAASQHPLLSLLFRIERAHFISFGLSTLKLLPSFNTPKISMLTVVRRGSASITKLLLIPSTSSPCVKSFISRSYRQHATQTPSPHLIRFLSTAPQWKQRNALANEDLEDEIVESQIEQKIQSQTPPSDSQTDEAAHHGPVTKFQGLLDRKLVCETVVKTITDVMRLETMTQVQSMTINETLKGIDV